MFAYGIFKVLYSPVKAFEEIAKKPSYVGVMLILILTLATSAGMKYAVDTKISVESGIPEKDDWTESENLWVSNGNLTLDDEDFIIGEHSVNSSVKNNTVIWMKISGFTPISCLGEEDYKRLSFRIKWIHQEGVSPSSNATLRLFTDGTDYFQLDILNFLNSSDTWANVTVNVGPEDASWITVGSADWGSITGLEFQLAWVDTANFTLKIDDLYFGRFIPYVATSEFNERFIGYIAWTTLDFLLRWLLVAGVLSLTMKIYGAKTGPWRFILSVIGYIFVAAVVGILISTAFIYTLPQINYPLLSWRYIRGEPLTLSERIAVEELFRIHEEPWYSSLAYQLNTAVSYLIPIWTIALCTIAVRSISKFPWGKSVLIGIFGYILAMFVRSLILGLTGI